MKRLFCLWAVLAIWNLPPLLAQQVLFPPGAFPVYSVVRPASNQALVVGRGDNALYVVDLSPAAPITTRVPLDRDANGMPFLNSQGLPLAVISPLTVAVNEVTKKAVVANFGSDNVSIVNLETRATEAVVPVGSQGSGPRGVAIDTQNNVAIVTHVNGNSVSLLNLNTKTPVLAAPIPVGNNPIGVVYDEKNKAALVANFGSASISTVVYDLVLKLGSVVNSVIVGSGPQEISLNPAAGLGAVSLSGGRGIELLDITTRPVISLGLVPLNGEPSSVAINPTTNIAAVLLRDSRTFTLIDLADGRKLSTPAVPIGSNPTHLAVNPNNNTLLVANPSSDIVEIVPMGFVNYFPLVMDTPQFRTNLGIRNLGEKAATVTISWGDKDGVFSNERSVEVGPRGFTQINSVLRFLTGGTSVTNISGSLRLTSNLPVNSFVSLIDNSTQDPALQVGASRGSPRLLLSSSTNVETFRTKLVILNLGSIGAAARIRARDKVTGEEVGLVGGIQIPPNGFHETDDIIGDLGLGSYFGSLEVDSPTAQPMICVALITSTQGNGGFLVAVPVDLPLVLE